MLLLGGPNTFIRGMNEAWKEAIPRVWEERKTPLPEGVDPQDLIKVPESAQYFAAIGAVEFGKSEDEGVGIVPRHQVPARLHRRRPAGGEGRGRRQGPVRDPGGAGQAFRERFTDAEKFVQAEFTPGQVVRGFIGLDGGSTSTKAALLSDEDGEVLARRTSSPRATPSKTPWTCSRAAQQQVETQGATLEVLGVVHHRLRQGHR